MNELKNSKGKSNIIIFFLLHIILCLFSLSGLFSKLASGESFLSINFCLFYGGVILILGIYAICWQQIIKRMPLSLAYANKAITVIWGMIWGILIFKEQLKIQQVIGAVIVIVGVVLYSMENSYERD
jgi:drug/metabolite transporter (DMT)-like permease